MRSAAASSVASSSCVASTAISSSFQGSSRIPRRTDHLQERQVDCQQNRDHDESHSHEYRRLNEGRALCERDRTLSVVKPGDLVEHLLQGTRTLADTDHVYGELRHP